MSDEELSRALCEWRTPAPPAQLRERLFPPKPWWRRMWKASVRIPVPVAICLAVAMGAGWWRWIQPPEPRVIVRTERAEAPELRPVTDLHLRTIKTSHEEN